MNDMVPASALAVQGSEQSYAQESYATALAAESKATIESRYIIALRRPRNWDQVRQSILHECKRPSFAHNKSAFYVKPIGDGVEGLGIRFVEVALRWMTNVLVESKLIFEDTVKEIHRVTVTDLESNLTYPLDVRVSKTVERRQPSDDGTYLAVRKNSYGKTVYTVPATDDDLLNKRAALISKAVRTLGLRIIPGDIQDEAESIIKEVRQDRAASDPDAERKRIADSFAELGVSATHLHEYLGHDLGTCSPAQLVELRGIYGAIKDGEATWKDVLDNKAAREGDRKPAPAVDRPREEGEKKSPTKATDKLKERIANAQKKAEAKKQAEAPDDGNVDPRTDEQIIAEYKAAATTDAIDIIDDGLRGIDETRRALLLEHSKRRRAEVAGE